MNRLLCSIAFDAFASPALVAEQPNILCILADDLGYGDVGCYNPESKIPTPNLDKLARQGIRFTDAQSPSTFTTLKLTPAKQRISTSSILTP